MACGPLCSDPDAFFSREQAHCAVRVYIKYRTTMCVRSGFTGRPVMGCDACYSPVERNGSDRRVEQRRRDVISHAFKAFRLLGGGDLTGTRESRRHRRRFHVTYFFSFFFFFISLQFSVTCRNRWYLHIIIYIIRTPPTRC